MDCLSNANKTSSFEKPAGSKYMHRYPSIEVRCATRPKTTYRTPVQAGLRITETAHGLKGLEFVADACDYTCDLGDLARAAAPGGGTSPGLLSPNIPSDVGDLDAPIYSVEWNFDYRKVNMNGP